MKLKKILILLLLLLGTIISVQAQDVKAAYTTDRAQHDFGTLAHGKTYTTTFTVTSTGEAPLVLIDARTGCKCTKASFPKKPLRKGEKAVVTVTFDADEAGYFHKTILLTTNAPKPATTLTIRITGNVKK